MTGSAADHLFSRRLLVQTGKGGTGKTTLSAALALLAAERGKRVLLIEVDTHDRLAPLFGRKEAVGYKPVELSPGVFGLNLDPELVIVDFFETHLRFKALYKQILDSKIFKYFYAAGPGLRELICLGKIWRLIEEEKRGKHVWDCIVLDAPATGHGLAILNIAQAAYDTLFGPMKANAKKIRDMLRDGRTTILNICAIPEEMPVNEAIELHGHNVSTLHMLPGFLLMNAVMPERFDEAALRPCFEGRLDSLVERRAHELLGGSSAMAALERACAYRASLRRRAHAHTERLKSAVPMPLLEVPLILDGDLGVRTLHEIVGALRRELARPYKATATPALAGAHA